MKSPDFVGINKIRYIDFNKPIDIEGFFIDITSNKGGSYGQSISLSFSNGLSTTLIIDQNINSAKYFKVDFKGVTRITFDRNVTHTTPYLQEFEIFTSSVSSDVYDLSYDFNYNSVLLNWKNPMSITSTDKILIYQDGEKIRELGHNVSSNVIDGLQPETEYTFRVAIEHQDGTITDGDTISVTTDEAPDVSTIPPGEISGLTIPAITHEAVQMNWINPLDTNFAGVVIYRNGDKIEDGLLTDTYTDTGLQPNTQYTYKIHTISQDGYMSAGVVQTVTTLTIQDNTPPDAPTGLSVAKGNKSGTVSWQHNTEPDMDGYNVYLNGVKVNTSLIKGSHFVFTNLDNGTDYHIEVTAVDLSGNESDHSVAVVLTPDEQSVPLIEAKYDLKSVADGVGNWFGSLWLILAFAVAIPLTFLISRRIKGLVLG